MKLPDSVYAFLQALAKPVARPQPKGRHPPAEPYAARALRDECDAVESEPEGTRNIRLNLAAFKLGTLVGARVLIRTDVERALMESARRAGLGETESRATIRSGLDAGILEPRDLSSVGRNGHHAPSRNGVPVQAAPQGRLIILASEVTPRRVEWLWPDRIPLGKLTTFAGWGGLGKSFVTMDLAARVSRGGDIPGTDGECFEPASVLILNTEDDPDDTSVPRLMEAGADLTRIGFAKSEVLGQFTLADLGTLDTMLGQLGDVRLLIIDPATAHLGDANDHKNAELRGLLMPLSLWAMERRIAVVLVTHVNKPQAGKVDAMARVVGSVAWVNAVRAAVMFAKDPEDKTRRLFIPFKSNNAPERKGLAYRIASTVSLARVEWLGEVDTSADDAMSPEGRKPRRMEAAKWLTERFRENPRWYSDDLLTAAKEAGISRCAVFEAKKVLDLPPCKQEMTLQGERAWVWWVPPTWEGFAEK